MGTWKSLQDAARRSALAGEAALQAVLRTGHAALATARTCGREPRAADLRGRRCHCAPDLPVHLVHSEGLREACDFVVDFGSNVRSRERGVWPPAKLRAAAAELPAGATIHVKTDRLEEFAATLLPALRAPAVLVTGDSDRAPVSRHAALLEHPRIAHWFVQNCDRPGRHPKLTRIPIGIDNPVFSKMEKRIGFALTMALGRSPADASFSKNDMGDQRVLHAVRAELPPPGERPARVLCTFHQNQKLIRPDLSGLPERARAARELAGNPLCHFPARRLRQRECWAAHGDHAFEVSPHGNGLDCFRTWEALALGTIPIVRRSTLDPLYEDNGLPVAIVDAWTEVTPENLGRWRRELAPRFGPGLDAKLSLSHWTEKLRRAAEAARREACADGETAGKNFR